MSDHHCDGLCCMVFGPGGSGTRMARRMEQFDREIAPPAKTLSERLHAPPVVPSAASMPEPCPCCGYIHAPKPRLRFDPLPGAQEPDGYLRPSPFE